ncbi:Phytochrome-like protein cph2 [compost metagenome]
MIDVDHFKSYNDSYGHIAGDEALKRVANTIFSSCDRSTDLAARFGGEEFALVLPGTPAGSARLAAEKLRRAVEAMQIPQRDAGTSPWLTVSVGTATAVPQADQPCTDLIQVADRSLYEAKRQGRNRVVPGQL